MVWEIQSMKGTGTWLTLLALKMEEGSHEPRIVSGHYNLGMARKQLFSQTFQKGAQPCRHLDFSQWDLCCTSDPQNCKIMNLCSFKPLCLWVLLWEQQKTNTAGLPRFFTEEGDGYFFSWYCIRYARGLQSSVRGILVSLRTCLLEQMRESGYEGVFYLKLICFQFSAHRCPLPPS